ncbi:MAG: tetratricopeptide repeat protein [Cyanobacteria bacterium SZAS LIN-3]|nr:tetratricopeptide repeat protein [Cyanobacteria bacterium SZAS LIN-3]
MNYCKAPQTVAFLLAPLLALCFATKPGYAGAGGGLAQGEALLEKKDYQGALAVFDSIIRSTHGTAPAYIDRGLTYRKLHQDQRAIDDFTRAIQLEPEHSPAYFYRGSANLVNGHYKEAIQDLTAATGIDPSEGAILLMRASAYTGLGLSHEAMADMEAARRIAKRQHPTYHMQVSNAMDSSGRGPGRLKGSLIADVDDFGVIEPGLLLNGACGLKTVGFGEQFYVVGETNEALFNKSATADGKGGNGWPEWRTNLARILARKWPADYAGQSQALIKVDRAGNISIEWLSYVPGANKQNLIATTAVEPQSELLFKKSVEQVVTGLKHSGSLAFPRDSTASEVLALAHFVSDYNLYVMMDDLTVFEGLPSTEKDVRIARVCSMLDTAQLYSLSNHFRKQLPAKLQHPFVKDGGHRYNISIWPDLWFVPCYTELKPVPLTAECSNFVEDFIDKCLMNRQYIKAEIAARYLAWASYCDRISQSAIDKATPAKRRSSIQSVYFTAPKKLATIENLRAKYSEIDAEMRKPKEKFADYNSPLKVR